jgi:hypothetical protein
MSKPAVDAMICRVLLYFVSPRWPRRRSTRQHRDAGASALYATNVCNWPSDQLAGRPLFGRPGPARRGNGALQ